MTYKDIPGWMDFEPCYDEAVAHFGDHALFVEVGVYLGRSLAYLAGKVIESKKKITVCGVDTFQGSGVENGKDNHVQAVLDGDGTFVGQTHRNLMQCGVAGPTFLIVGDSQDAARLFFDGSIDLVFLDARHDEASVRADIEAWLPKVRPGGWIGGDDLSPVWPGVERAVAALLPGWERWGHDSWRFRVPAQPAGGQDGR